MVPTYGMISSCDRVDSEHSVVPISIAQSNMENNAHDIDMCVNMYSLTPYAADCSHTPTSLHMLASQLKVTKDKIIAALSRFDDIY